MLLRFKFIDSYCLSIMDSWSEMCLIELVYNHGFVIFEFPFNGTRSVKITLGIWSSIVSEITQCLRLCEGWVEAFIPEVWLLSLWWVVVVSKALAGLGFSLMLKDCWLYSWIEANVSIMPSRPVDGLVHLLDSQVKQRYLLILHILSAPGWPNGVLKSHRCLIREALIQLDVSQSVNPFLHQTLHILVSLVLKDLRWVNEHHTPEYRVYTPLRLLHGLCSLILNDVVVLVECLQMIEIVKFLVLGINWGNIVVLVQFELSQTVKRGLDIYLSILKIDSEWWLISLLRDYTFECLSPESVLSACKTDGLGIIHTLNYPVISFHELLGRGCLNCIQLLFCSTSWLPSRILLPAWCTASSV